MPKTTIKMDSKVLDDLVRKECIEFAEWISNHKLDFQTASNSQWVGVDCRYITSETLYDLFLKQKQK